MQILVDHLGELARTGRPEQLAHAGIGGDHLLGAAIGFGLPAAHHGEHPVLGAGLAAGDGRIDEREAALLRLGGKLAGDLGRSGGVIHEHRALLHPMEGAVGSQRDLAQVVVVADAAHDEVLAFGCRFGGWRAAPLMLGNPLLRLGRSAVVDDQVMAALVLEVARHRVPHDPETEKSYFRHPVLPLVSRFRRSYHFEAPDFTNVGNKGTLASHDPSVALHLTFLLRTCGQY